MAWVSSIIGALGGGKARERSDSPAGALDATRERLIRRGLIIHNRDHEKAIAFADAHLRLLVDTQTRAHRTGPTAAQRHP